MTMANEVHLFVWIKENAAVIGSFLVVAWGLIVYWFKTIVNKFLTREEIAIKIDERINACKGEVDKADDQMLDQLKHLNTKLDRMDDRRREDAMANAAAHEHILTIIAHRDDS